MRIPKSKDSRRLKAMTEAQKFIKGESDCAEGLAHYSGKGEAYDRGYAAQYEREQQESNLSIGEQHD
jgi:hypothetical protein